MRRADGRTLAKRVSDVRHETGVQAMKTRELLLEFNQRASCVDCEVPDGLYEDLRAAEDLLRGAMRAMAHVAGRLRR